MSEVYRITNTVNGHKYVGQTRGSSVTRWAQHKCAARKGSRGLLHKAIRKYGADGFTVEVVGTYCTKQELDAAEQAAICAFNAHKWDGGYNLSFGGENTVTTEETKRKLRAARAKQVITPEHKTAISSSLRAHLAAHPRDNKTLTALQAAGASALRGKPWPAARRAAHEKRVALLAK